ncbi:MAG: hypothetical protein K2M95_03725 [Clostridiales bacterium]|nr:hypothetical protein [Clostridiales bacterium]
MKITILGTAACEGIPAMFCNCDTCRKAAALGGRELRTRSQALVDDDLLIDFPADTYMHVLREGFDLSRIDSLLITHSHPDHLYPDDLTNRDDGLSHNRTAPKLTVYGSDFVADRLEREFPAHLPLRANVGIRRVKAYEPIAIGKYTVTPLPAVHTLPPEQGLLYLIEKGGETFLYGLDTYFPEDGVTEYLVSHGKKVDIACLDCTRGLEEADKGRHMNADMVVRLTDLLRKKGVFTAKTAVIATHFSHNGKALHGDLEARLGAHGIAVAYDGMKVTTGRQDE